MTEKPLLCTDGRYVFAHHLGRLLGPFNYNRNADFNAADPYGVPFNPQACVGGKIHHVENPMFPPCRT